MTIADPHRGAGGPADFGEVDDVVPGPWSGAVVATVDIVGISCATALAAFVLADRTSGLRAALALVFFLVVPGWAFLRGVRARPCSMTLMAAVGLSISFTVIGAEVMVTRMGFPWKGATVLACGLSAMVLLVDVGAHRWQ